MQMMKNPNGGERMFNLATDLRISKPRSNQVETFNSSSSTP